MDHDEARRAAVAHFTDGGTKNAGWTVTGPTSRAGTATPEGGETLVFKFRPPAANAWTRRSSPMHVAVDLETGVAQSVR